MENKKISFGFSKIAKKNEIKPIKKQTLELIDCLEGQSIKIKGSEAVKKDEPLVIHLKDSSKSLLDRIRESKQKNVKTEVKEEIERPDSELTIDELAARELLRDAQNREKGLQPTTKVVSLPLTADDKFVAEGEAEPTLDDYDNVPIGDFGMAMLRGMGWKEGTAIGKDPTKVVPVVDPELRPRGLGLGADKLVNVAKKEQQQADKDGKELELVKGGYGKIIAGQHRGEYCQIQGFDDQSCRIIVKTARQNLILTLQEFLVVPVTKDEYNIGSKVINNAKYEEYKSNEKSQQNSQNNDRNSSEEESDHRRKHSKKHRRSRDRSPHSHSHKHKSSKKKSKSRRRSRSRSHSRR